MTSGPAIQIRLVAARRVDLEAVIAELVAMHPAVQIGSPCAGQRAEWLVYGTLAIADGNTAPAGVLPTTTRRCSERGRR